MSYSEETRPWYAVRTRANHEKTASTVLEAKGYQPYLPTYKVRRRWSDRVVETLLPLFPGYVFCRFDAKLRSPIITTPGVVSVVGFGADPAPIPDNEIVAIETALRSGLSAEPYAFLSEGQRVRVTRGSLEGVEGVLIKKKNDWRLVISVTMLQRSLSVEIDREWLSAA
ncbi:MAG TPA: UpxY family transcription antiterminator [Bryobacteraceae bacterium]|jgi:transcription antitermination factor NusG|nr:UpxY family transcription antiterminator [Bryobacteraceae bacterium]